MTPRVQVQWNVACRRARAGHSGAESETCAACELCCYRINMCERAGPHMNRSAGLRAWSESPTTMYSTR